LTAERLGELPRRLVGEQVLGLRRIRRRASDASALSTVWDPISTVARLLHGGRRTARSFYRVDRNGIHPAGPKTTQILPGGQCARTRR
jgi:hypothetical protein